MDELMYKLITLSPDGDGAGDDSSSDKSDDSDDDVDEGEDKSKSKSKKVDEDELRKSKAHKAFEDRKWKRETSDELSLLKTELSGIKDGLDGFKAQVLEALKKTGADEGKISDDKNAGNQKSVEADGTAKLFENLMVKLDAVDKKVDAKFEALSSEFRGKDLASQRRDALVEVGVSNNFLRLFKDGYVNIPDKIWEDGPDKLVDTLKMMGAFPMDTTNETRKAGSSDTRQALARRDTAGGAGAIHADQDEDVRTAKAKVVKDIDKEFKKMRDAGGLETEGLTRILEQVDKLEHAVDTF